MRVPVLLCLEMTFRRLNSEFGWCLRSGGGRSCTMTSTSCAVRARMRSSQALIDLILPKYARRYTRTIHDSVQPHTLEGSRFQIKTCAYVVPTLAITPFRRFHCCFHAARSLRALVGSMKQMAATGTDAAAPLAAAPSETGAPQRRRFGSSSSATGMEAIEEAEDEETGDSLA